jgi:hypothetical protein
MFNPNDGNTDPNNLQGQQIGYVRLTQLANDFLEVTKSQAFAFKNSAEYLTKMDQNMGSLVKSMGVTREYSQLLKQELGRAVTEVTAMGGKQEDINRLQKEYIEATNRTIVLSTENVEKLFAVSQVTGVAAKTLETSFRNAGMETTHIEEEMRTVYNTANSMGVNAQVVSAMVVNNLDKMNRYGFGTGVEGMAKMAAKAAAMRVDISQTMAVADKLFSPESAIDVASTLQRLGATSSALLDPLKLMDLAQNNVPELQNQLSELSKTFTKFDEKTGKFQIMPEARRQLGEVATALGIDRAEFEKMALESAKIEKKMSEIDFSGLMPNATEEDKMLVANLAEFNKAKGEYTVKFTDPESGKTVEKGLSELKDGQYDYLNELKKQQNLDDPQKQLVDVAKQQLSYTETLVNQNASLNATIQTQYAITKEGQDYLKSAVEAQIKAYEVGFSKFSLDKSNKREFGTTTYETLTKLNKGELQMTDEAIKKLITDIGLGIGENYIDVATQLGEKIEQNPFNAALGSVASKMEIVDKTLTTVGVDLKAIGDVLTTAAVEFPIIKSVLNFITGTNLPEEKDVVVNANGSKFSLDKGDLLMAVNQEMLAQSIGASGQVFANNTTPETKSSPKEIKITLDVNANSNDLQVKNAILSAFNNDDTLRTLRDKIGVVGSDYGLTV